MGDPFLDNYRPDELRIASEFLTTWLPFLQRDLCSDCAVTLANRVRSLDPGTTKVVGSSKPRQFEGNRRLGHHPSVEEELNVEENGYNNYDANSLGSADHDEADTNSLGSWKDGAQGISEFSPEPSSSNSVNEFPAVEVRSQHMSWADMAQEDELEEEEDELEDKRVVNMNASTGELRVSTIPDKPKLSRDQREQFRFMNVKRNKDFICLERINGKLVNILQGLELHAGVFSAAEQKRMVDFVYELQESGRKGILKERTYSAPAKWMRGKGRVTLQFGCCYNYAPDKNGNPPGILLNETVDPIPHLFKVIIRRLVRWHVLPPTCVPDSCIVNIYEEGDCIPPHIDNHDFVRPFCTVSFLSECSILFGSNLKITGPGEFIGSFELPLPMGSVLVLNGNGADVAKHCVPAVPTKRISITFRRMDESKRPKGYYPEPDLLGIQPLSYEEEQRSRQPNSLNQGRHHGRRQQQQGRRDSNSGGRGYLDRRDSHPDSSNSYSSHNRRGPSSRQRFRPNPSG